MRVGEGMLAATRMTDRAGASMMLLAQTGSRAYGTDHTDSDYDFRGVYRAPLRAILALNAPPQTLTSEDAADITLYELRHFAALAAKANPTALEILWSDARCTNPAALGPALRAHRQMFLSKRVVRTYGGYAMSQVKKATAGTGGSRGAEHYKRVKFRLHTLRLLAAGQHILEHGEVLVKVSNPAALRALAESCTDSDLEAVVTEGLHAMDELAAKSPLPDHPDESAINALLYRIRMAEV